MRATEQETMRTVASEFLNSLGRNGGDVDNVVRCYEKLFGPVNFNKSLSPEKAMEFRRMLIQEHARQQRMGADRYFEFMVADCARLAASRRKRDEAN